MLALRRAVLFGVLSSLLVLPAGAQSRAQPTVHVESVTGAQAASVATAQVHALEDAIATCGPAEHFARLGLVIDRAGAVRSMRPTSGATLAADRAWRRCTLRALGAVHFSPGGGTVTLSIEWPPRTMTLGTTGGSAGTGTAISDLLTGPLTPEVQEVLAAAEGVEVAPPPTPTPAPTPTPTLDVASLVLSVEGALTEAEAAAVLTRQRGTVRRCWASTRAEHPEWTGRVILRISVEATGVTESAEAEQSVTGPPIGRCLIQAARRWRFPAHDAPTQLRAAFDLTLGEP